LTWFLRYDFILILGLIDFWLLFKRLFHLGLIILKRSLIFVFIIFVNFQLLNFLSLLSSLLFEFAKFLVVHFCEDVLFFTLESLMLFEVLYEVLVSLQHARE